MTVEITFLFKVVLGWIELVIQLVPGREFLSLLGL